MLAFSLISISIMLILGVVMYIKFLCPVPAEMMASGYTETLDGTDQESNFGGNIAIRN